MYLKIIKTFLVGKCFYINAKQYKESKKTKNGTNVDLKTDSLLEKH